MGIAVNGGSAGMPGGVAGKATGFMSTNNSIARMMEQQKKKNARPKKKLNYNPREISGQLVRANKSRNAAVVLTRARMRLSSLHQAHATGQYKEAEVRIAMAHARKMVECSRLKVQNLKEEEILKGRNDRDKRIGEMQKKNEVKRRVRKKEQDARVKMSIEESQRVLKEKTKRQILLQKRRMHRNDERRKITEADLKYLEDQLRNNRAESEERYDGASLDLSMEAAQMSELQMIEQQIQQQVEMEVELEYAAIDAGSISAAAMPAAAASLPAGGAPAAPTVNITV